MITRSLLQSGCKVYIVSRNGEECRKVAQQLETELQAKGRVIALPGCDVSKEKDIQTNIVKQLDANEKIHILVNNAGTNWAESIDSYPENAFDKLMALNTKSVFIMTKLLLPFLERAATKEDPSRIINIGSVHGLRVPTVETYAYSASKAGMAHLSKHSLFLFPFS